MSRERNMHGHTDRSGAGAGAGAGEDLGAQCASLRDSLYAETGALAGRPDAQRVATTSFLRAQDYARRLVNTTTQGPVADRLAAELSSAAAMISAASPFDDAATDHALTAADAALADLARAFGFQP